MILSSITISNYRNLDGMRFNFHEEITFLVGENNIGKSNLLSLINIVFNKQSFKVEDFYDPNKKIELEISLLLNDNEKGIFEDLFDPRDHNKINIIVRQETPNDFINIIHKETETSISNNSLKSIVHIFYGSLRNPLNELSFDRGKGTGKFLKYLISYYLSENQTTDLDFIDDNKLKGLRTFINDIFKKLKTFKDFKINADIHNEIENLLARIFVLKDNNNFSIEKSGYGVQYAAIISLAILERISNLTEKRLDKILVLGEEGEKFLPLIFTLDEPEIHFHPYMQRSIVKSLNKIIQDEDGDFRKILKQLFDIDGIYGQCIIVTHSPNMLLNDYKQIIRFFRDGQNSINQSCGNDIDIPKNLEKHLLMNMHYIKEAFFSKCVIIVEGESEYGCMDLFAGTMGVDLDDLGICILKANGADSIEPLMKLLEGFGIYAIGVIDNDKYREKKEKLKKVSNLLHTARLDFEEEIISICFDNDGLCYLEHVVKQYDPMGLERNIQSGKINKIARKYQIQSPDLNGNYKFSDVSDLELLKLMYLSWFDINKSVILGREVGDSFPIELIPEIYKEAIITAQELLGHGS